MKIIIVLLAFSLLFIPVHAADYVYLSMNGQSITNTNQELEAGKLYTFYGHGSSNVNKVVIYIKDQNARDEGQTVSIQFTPQAGNYELDIIGFSGTKQVVSQKFYLHVVAKEPAPEAPAPTEEPSEPAPPTSCVEDWFCTVWSECTDGKQTRTCIDRNSCRTTGNKPVEQQSCSSASEEAQPPSAPEEPKSTEPQQKCTYTGQSDFINFCECLKENKQTNIFQVKNSNSIKIGFANSPMTLNAVDYNKDLSETDLAVIFNIVENKLYTFYGSAVDRNKVQNLITSNNLENQFSNDACSAFKNFLDVVKKEQIEKEPELSSDPNIKILILPVNWEDKNTFKTSAAGVRARLIKALPLSSCENKIS